MTEPRASVSGLPGWASRFPLDRCVRTDGHVFLSLGERLLPMHRLLNPSTISVLHEVIITAYWCFDRLTLLMIRERGGQTEALESLAHDSVEECRMVPEAEVRKAKRNEPCPWGRSDGRKAKHCHGRPSLSADQFAVALDATAREPFENC